jgi:hypothetical protein
LIDLLEQYPKATVFEVLEATGNFKEDAMKGGVFIPWRVFLFETCN